jgi:hypothetical protein
VLKTPERKEVSPKKFTTVCSEKSPKDDNEVDSKFDGHRLRFHFGDQF